MNWNALHQRMLNISLMTIICYVPLSAFYLISRLSLQENTPDLLFHPSPVLKLLAVVAMLTAFAASAAFVALRGFQSFAWVSFLACCLWFTLEIQNFIILLWGTYIGMPGSGFIWFYQTIYALKHSFLFPPFVLLTFTLTPFLLLTTRRLSDNSLLSVLTGPAVPILLIAAFLLLPPMIASLCLAAGTIILWYATGMQKHPVNSLLTCLIALFLISLAGGAWKEYTVLTSEFPGFNPQTDFNRGPDAIQPAITWLAPLLVALLTTPRIPAHIRKITPAVFIIATVSWFLASLTDLRTGPVSLTTAINHRELSIPATIDRNPALSFAALLWLINAGLILWYYLQVWKAR